MLHKNIENLAAAKAVKYSTNNTNLTLNDIRERGEKQFKLELSQKNKKRSESEKQLRQLKKATKKLLRN